MVHEDKRQRMYNFVRRLVGEGRQAYIICPAVEEKAEDGGQGGQWAQAEARPDLKAATTYAETLRTQVFPDLRVAFLHGKMRPREKEAVMSSFADGEIDVLVSTTVVEVGVDVPNAALIKLGGVTPSAASASSTSARRGCAAPSPTASSSSSPHQTPGPVAYSGSINPIWLRIAERTPKPGARRLLRQPPARPATAGTGRSVGGPPPAPGGPGRCTQSAPERPRPHPAGEPPRAGAGAPAVCRHPGHFQLRSVSLFL